MNKRHLIDCPWGKLSTMHLVSVDVLVLLIAMNQATMFAEIDSEPNQPMRNSH